VSHPTYSESLKLCVIIPGQACKSAPSEYGKFSDDPKTSPLLNVITSL